MGDRLWDQLGKGRLAHFFGVLSSRERRLLAGPGVRWRSLTALARLLISRFSVRFRVGALDLRDRRGPVPPQVPPLAQPSVFAHVWKVVRLLRLPVKTLPLIPRWVAGPTGALVACLAPTEGAGPLQTSFTFSFEHGMESDDRWCESE